MSELNPRRPWKGAGRRKLTSASGTQWIRDLCFSYVSRGQPQNHPHSQTFSACTALRRVRTQFGGCLQECAAHAVWSGPYPPPGFSPAEISQQTHRWSREFMCLHSLTCFRKKYLILCLFFANYHFFPWDKSKLLLFTLTLKTLEKCKCNTLWAASCPAIGHLECMFIAHVCVSNEARSIGRGRATESVQFRVSWDSEIVLERTNCHRSPQKRKIPLFLLSWDLNDSKFNFFRQTNFETYEWYWISPAFCHACPLLRTDQTWESWRSNNGLSIQQLAKNWGGGGSGDIINRSTDCIDFDRSETRRRNFTTRYCTTWQVWYESPGTGATGLAS